MRLELDVEIMPVILTSGSRSRQTLRLSVSLSYTERSGPAGAIGNSLSKRGYSS